MVKIVFTGGGSAGHVTPNMALIESAQLAGWQCEYIGSYDGIEKQLISGMSIPYHGISSGKLRRQFTLKNALTPVRVIQGILQAWQLLAKIKPDIVFSKGGYVAFPVVFAAWLRRIPVIIHESDLSPGLANRMSFPFAKFICVTFPEGKNYFTRKDKVIITGSPIRLALFQGSAQRGLAWCGFSSQKPVILIMGGGLGAHAINHSIRTALPQLLQEYQLIHICGPGKCDPTLETVSGYKQVEYIHEPLPDVFACADLVISRAGANSLCEILMLKKPHILIPLSKKASRGDQIENAQYFQTRGLSVVLSEENLTAASLLAAIASVMVKQEQFKEKLAQANLPNATNEIIARIDALVGAK